MIGQKIGLDYLIPLVLESLEDNILLEGNFYCGDLLNVHWKVYSRVLDLGNKKNPFVWFEGLFYKPSFKLFGHVAKSILSLQLRYLLNKIQNE